MSVVSTQKRLTTLTRPPHGAGGPGLSGRMREDEMEHVIDYYLDDDGTMDTVVLCECSCGHSWTEHIDSETVSAYRDEDTGILYLEDMCQMMDDLGMKCPASGQ